MLQGFLRAQIHRGLEAECDEGVVLDSTVRYKCKRYKFQWIFILDFSICEETLIAITSHWFECTSGISWVRVGPRSSQDVGLSLPDSGMSVQTPGPLTHPGWDLHYCLKVVIFHGRCQKTLPLFSSIQTEFSGWLEPWALGNLKADRITTKPRAPDRGWGSLLARLRTGDCLLGTNRICALHKLQSPPVCCDTKLHNVIGRFYIFRGNFSANLTAP